LLAGAVAAYAEEGGPALAPLAVAIAFFVIVGAFAEIAERTRLFRVSAGETLHRAAGLPRSSWGAAFAHCGLGIALLGITAATAWNVERIEMMRTGQAMDVGGKSLVLTETGMRGGPNYQDFVARFDVREAGLVTASVESSKRLFAVRQMTTTEAGLVTFGVSQLYVSLGEIADGGAVAVRAQWKPLVLLIWLGPMLMAFGGLLSLADRRLRVGAPRPARQRLQAAE
jgi:cytochrome c-type biogenesis protein CcmF